MAVKDEQEYIVVRERTHRNTAESTNDRVKWWSVAQVIILIGVVGWQVYYLQVRAGPRYLTCLILTTSVPVLLRSKTCILSLFCLAVIIYHPYTGFSKRQALWIL